MHREGHLGLGLLVYAPVAYWLVAHDLLQAMGLGFIAVGF